jgi:hypothetical protein
VCHRPGPHREQREREEEIVAVLAKERKVKPLQHHQHIFFSSNLFTAPHSSVSFHYKFHLQTDLITLSCTFLPAAACKLLYLPPIYCSITLVILPSYSYLLPTSPSPLPLSSTHPSHLKPSPTPLPNTYSSHLRGLSSSSTDIHPTRI